MTNLLSPCLRDLWPTLLIWTPGQAVGSTDRRHEGSAAPGVPAGEPGVGTSGKGCGNQEGCTGMALGVLITALVSGYDQSRRPRQRKETARAYGYEGMACVSGERDLEKGGGRRGPDLVRKSLHLWAVRRSWGWRRIQGRLQLSGQIPCPLLPSCRLHLGKPPRHMSA